MAQRLRLIASGYTASADEDGVRAFDASADGSGIAAVGGRGGIQSPSFCCAASRGGLYVAGEMPERGCLGRFGADGIAEQLAFKKAAGTCFVLEHPEGLRLYGADYDSGSVCSCALALDGSMAGPVHLVQHEGHGASRATSDPNRERQNSPHVHTLSFVPGTNLLAAVDLGLDLIVLYRTDEEGRIVDAQGETALSPWPEGDRADSEARFPVRPAALVEAPLLSGPRIIAYHPHLPMAALVCELGCEVVLYRLSADGLLWQPFARWDLLQDVPAAELKALDGPPLAAHCAFSPDGRFLYASTRGTDRITAFALDDGCRLVERFDAPCGGRTPRHFALSPDGGLLAVANQGSGDVALFKRSAATGKLVPAARIPFPRVSCIVWNQR